MGQPREGWQGPQSESWAHWGSLWDYLSVVRSCFVHLSSCMLSFTIKEDEDYE